MNQLDLKTSTGLPYRKPTVRFQRRSGLESVFPQESKAKRPLSDTIRKPIAEVAGVLNRLEDFPKFFDHLEKVEILESGNANWYFKASERAFASMKRVWADDLNLFIWKTVDGADFHYMLGIELVEAQAGRGTIARIMTAYNSTSTGLLARLDAIFGEEASLIAKKSLQRLKAYCETGHVPTTEGQPSGRDDDSYIISPRMEETVLKH